MISIQNNTKILMYIHYFLLNIVLLFSFKICHDLNFKFVTKAKAMERCELRVQFGSHIHTFGRIGECEGMNPHTPKWVFIWGVGIPMDSQNFRKPFEGSKFIGLKSSLYHSKVLET
jgi:hypothetical protein